MRPDPRGKPIPFCLPVVALCLLRQLCGRFRRKRSIFRCILAAKRKFRVELQNELTGSVRKALLRRVTPLQCGEDRVQFTDQLR